MNERADRLVEAATLLDRGSQLLLTEAEALHAETWILAVARMAGTQLQRAVLNPLEEVATGIGPLAGGHPWEQPWIHQGGNQGGRRLVALLLTSLHQLGEEPLEQEAILCPTEGTAAARLDLGQTRQRLDPLVAACGRTLGLRPADLAEALTVATALAIHRCRPLVLLERAVGLAVAGLVEGAKTQVPTPEAIRAATAPPPGDRGRPPRPSNDCARTPAAAGGAPRVTPPPSPAPR